MCTTCHRMSSITHSNIPVLHTLSNSRRSSSHHMIIHPVRVSRTLPKGRLHFLLQLSLKLKAEMQLSDFFEILYRSNTNACILVSSARIIDFHKPTGPADTHPRLFEWVKQYFLSGGSTRLPPRLIRTSLPPLYLQHQGTLQPVPRCSRSPRTV